MKWRSTIFDLAILSTFILSGCTYNCACEDTLPDQSTTQSYSYHPVPKGAQLIDECKFINEGIADSKSFSQKMSKSRYAIQYMAMSRERISNLQTRAKEIGCQ